MPNNALFIGFSGPIGYNYSFRRPYGTPNPVLEDVTGILLCYDELVFLSKDFCPRDMWDLPYVSFLADHSAQLSSAAVAVEQANEVLKEFGSLRGDPAWGVFTKTIDAMTGASRWAIDNHSRGLMHVEGFDVPYGDSTNSDYAFYDAMIAASMQRPSLDVLTNSVASQSVVGSETTLDASLGNFTRHQLRVAERLSHIRLPNRLTGEGGYISGVEELRSSKFLPDLRNHLVGQREDRDPDEVVKDMQEEVNRLAYQELGRNVDNASIYHTLRSWAASTLTTAALTPVSDLAVKLAVGRRLRQRKWMAFVADMVSSRS